MKMVLMSCNEAKLFMGGFYSRLELMSYLFMLFYYVLSRLHCGYKVLHVPLVEKL
jgi:hypothetical protein